MTVVEDHQNRHMYREGYGEGLEIAGNRIASLIIRNYQQLRGDDPRFFTRSMLASLHLIFYAIVYNAKRQAI